MSALPKVTGLVLKRAPRAFARGSVLSATVLAMGVSLLALSGWFITSAAAAGLLGFGAVFNIFVPSALVRFLALARTAARYGERLTTHEATLEALAALRMQVLSGILHFPYRSLERLRASVFLNRVTADIDALDGLALRLVLPGIAGLAIVFVSSAVVAFLTHPLLGIILAFGYGVVPSLGFLYSQRLVAHRARRVELGLQALRTRAIEFLNLREVLVVFGQQQKEHAHVQKAQAHHASAQAELARLDRRSGIVLDVLATSVTGACVAVGFWLADVGSLSPARAAIAVFAALALFEAVAPIRRALAEIGRMQAAANRLAPLMDETDAQCAPARERVCLLRATEVQLCREGGDLPLFQPLHFALTPGQSLALTGPSGCGKSSVLLAIAGHGVPSQGDLQCVGASGAMGPTEEGRWDIAMVSQRHDLVAGTFAENLRLAASTATDAALWAALRAVCLSDVVTEKGGLDAKIGFRGDGVSGGEGRRLALARAVLRAPSVLLLDEPTEGLDANMAERVLTGIRNALPDAMLILAAHRPQEVSFADQVVAL